MAVATNHVVTSQTETEANTFAIQLLLKDRQFQNCKTRAEVIDKLGIPAWVEKYVNWNDFGL